MRCSLNDTPVLSGGTWVINVSAGNAPGKNAGVHAYASTDFVIQCPSGTSNQCYSGDPNTIDVGECHPGTMMCLGDGTWTSCQGEVAPVTEICGDNLDNDCNGLTDESCSCNEQNCDDGISCTVDTCDSILGCNHVPDNSLCDDNVSCTIDACDAIGGCTSQIASGSCEIDGQCYNNGAMSPDGCGVCNSAISNITWTQLSSSTICRAAISDCDMPEFCNGASTYCPTDTYLPAGTTCGGGGGSCDASVHCVFQ